ncbi:uncharacterized protein LOC110771842 [Prunus avium]|uniref:Uncharacterized protein LOC110771842 n=1 Tax=Prunus avium TaxID=42229 RepID=A0A6P5TXJ7_PRUAV|nr:uncharacterized protein LOC110771842 [Prunus avium]
MDRVAGSIVHPLYFDGNNYGAWKAQMKSFLWSLDKRVWNTVVHGFPEPTKKIKKGDEETTVLKTREEFTTVTHEGTDTVKGAKLQMNTLQFKTIIMDENETFSEIYAKLCIIVNACSSLGEKIPKDRVVKKILRSLPQHFQPKITAIEEICDLNTLKVRELIRSLQTYEMKHLASKKSKSVALKVVDKEDGEHQSKEFNGEEFAYLSRQFNKFFKNQNSRSHESRNHSGYGHIASECANTQKKQNGKAKALNVTWRDSDSESESEENTIVLITTISLDEAQQNNANDEGPNIDYVLEKYDDLLATSYKLNKHNRELAKRVAVLELENSRTARMLQSSDAEPEIVGCKMISMGRSDGDKRGLGFDSINKSPAVSVTNGCSRHLIGDKSCFSEISTECVSGMVTFGDGRKSKILGKGKIMATGTPSLDNVLLVENLQENLISVSQLCDEIGELVIEHSVSVEFYIRESLIVVGAANATILTTSLVLPRIIIALAAHAGVPALSIDDIGSSDTIKVNNQPPDPPCPTRAHNL